MYVRPGFPLKAETQGWSGVDPACPGVDWVGDFQASC